MVCAVAVVVVVVVVVVTVCRQYMLCGRREFYQASIRWLLVLASNSVWFSAANIRWLVVLTFSFFLGSTVSVR